MGGDYRETLLYLDKNFSMKQETIQQVQEFRSLTGSVWGLMQSIQGFELQISELETQKNILREAMENQKKQVQEEKKKLWELVDVINESIKEEIENLKNIQKKCSILEERGFSSQIEQQELTQAFETEIAAFDEYNRIITAYWLEKIELPKRNFIYKPQELQAETLQKSI